MNLYHITAAGLLDGQNRLETISRNAASSSMPGYRRQVTASRSFAADLAQSERSSSTNLASKSTPVLARVDTRPGPIIATGRSLDVAIESSDLYFALSDGASTWFTKAGSFQIDETGMLVGERGLRVQGTAGDIRLDSADVQIDRNGQIVHKGMVVAALQLFQPAESSVLESAGGALITSSLGFHPVMPGSIGVRGGALEGSNAGASTEMVDLLTLTRQFESLVRVTQGYDELLGRTIQKLGEI